MSREPPLSVHIKQFLALIQGKREEMQKLYDDLVFYDHFLHDQEIQQCIKSHISIGTKRITIAPAVGHATTPPNNSKLGESC